MIFLIILFSPLILLIGLGILLYKRVAGNSITGGSDTPEYPYRRKYMSHDQLIRAFENVKNYKLKFVHQDYRINNMPEFADLNYRGEINAPTIIELDPGDYETTNWMSDWFNEKCRLQCKRYDEETSPAEYWDEHHPSIIKHHDSLRAQSDAVYEKIIGCNNFRPGLMRGFIEFFGAKSVLDPSAGWGDRLIGAIAAGVTYTGVDPNPCVHKGYAEILREFVDEKSAEYKLIQAPFQTAELSVDENGSPITYDLIFTSPPYFDLEIYDDNPMQSSAEFPALDDWFNNFLMFSLKKAWDVLNPGGHMVIIINNTKGRPDYVKRMITSVGEFPAADYLGVISYAEKRGHGDRAFYKSPQPMWIWRKSESTLGSNDEIPNTSKRLTLPTTPAELNPPIVIEEITSDLTGNALKVIRDDLLPGGTKQRAGAVISRIPADEIVYAGPWNGYAQAALAIAAKVYGKKATVFLADDSYYITDVARNAGAQIKLIKNASLKELQIASAEYCKDNLSRQLMPFGFDSEDFREELTARIIDAVEPTIDLTITATIWLVGGSATLVNVLYRVFPRANFGLVQVGKTIWPDQIDPTRTTLYIAPEKFYADAEIVPAYPSAIKYDAKAWRFAREFAQPGDIIWNVAG